MELLEIPSPVLGHFQVAEIDGLNYAGVWLRPLLTHSFEVSHLLTIFTALRVPGWCEPGLDPTSVLIEKQLDCLMDAAFVVSQPSSSAPTLLFRKYDYQSKSGTIHFPQLRIANILSSRYQLTPKVFGSFLNGRIEEYLDSSALMPSDLRDKSISLWIAARMAELHSIPLTDIKVPFIRSDEEDSWDMIKKRFRELRIYAGEMFARETISEDDRAALDMDTLNKYWNRYTEWLSRTEKEEGITPRVFCHNDLHCKNILRLKDGVPVDTPEYRQILIMGYMYAGKNPLAFDIANHFQEWTCGFVSPSIRVLDYHPYPSREERYDFYRAYLTRAASLDSSDEPVISDASLDRLERQVRIWTPAVYAFWTLDAMQRIEGREDKEKKKKAEGEEKAEKKQEQEQEEKEKEKKLEEQSEDTDFNWISYAKARMKAFIRGVKELDRDPCPTTLIK